MDKPVNLKEAKELVQIYRSLTMEDLSKRWNEWMENPDNEDVLLCGEGIGEILGTGFSDPQKCSLCVTVRAVGNCGGCLYQTTSNYTAFPCCRLEEHKTTYNSISCSNNPQELYVAINERADYIEQLINKWENKEFDNKLNNLTP